MATFNHSDLFTGYPQNVVPEHNLQAVANNTFYTVGKIIATCIIEGGEAQVCFSHAVADYMRFTKLNRVEVPVAPS